jgi:cellulose synthase/poly-beta-1,6-N-acetylglucosamine synthase-like glycosyltransferase
LYFPSPTVIAPFIARCFSQNIPDCRIEVVVVDNDPQQSAANVLAEFKAEHHDQLIVLNLSQPNISSQEMPLSALQVASGYA